MFYGLPHRDAATYICEQRRRRQRYPQNEQHTVCSAGYTRDVPTTDLSHDVSRSVAVTSVTSVTRAHAWVQGNWLNVPRGAVL